MCIAERKISVLKTLESILDASPKLSDELIDIVQTALSSGVDVEERMSQFFYAHVTEFRLTRA